MENTTLTKLSNEEYESLISKAFQGVSCQRKNYCDRESCFN